MANARWDRWRANVASRPEPEPKMERWYQFQYAIRDKLSGEEAWRDLVSLRQMTAAARLVLKHYSPGEGQSTQETVGRPASPPSAPLIGSE
jgi:hypothetical protein